MSADTGNSSAVSRRDFLKCAGCAAAAGAAAVGHASAVPVPELRGAEFWVALDDGAIRCGLCPWECVVRPGQRGRCGVRENRAGKYYTLVYGHPCALNNDPIEKKPFFHVFPGCKAFSIATVGCNIHCKFCQNWDISQAKPEDVPVPFHTPEAIADLAARARSRAVAYTYSEPTIYYEYMADCARAARDRGLANLMVSNGFMTKEALRKLIPRMDAIKIDLKAFTDGFYRDVCDGQLAPVLDTLKTLADSGVWFEIVVLLISTLNDGDADLRRMTDWIVKELGRDVPVHFTRFHPDYQLRNIPATPPRTLQRARETAMAGGCRFVYTGNLPGNEGENTFCPTCKACVVSRYGHMAITSEITGGKCPKCGAVIPGRWT